MKSAELAHNIIKSSETHGPGGPTCALSRASSVSFSRRSPQASGMGRAAKASTPDPTQQDLFHYATGWVGCQEQARMNEGTATCWSQI